MAYEVKQSQFKSLRVAVTGANGYVGRLVAERFRQSGWRVVSMTRTRPDASTGYEHLPFVLGETPPVEPLRHATTLVHCAYDFTVLRPREIQRVNVQGTQRLLEAASRANISQLILVSSMSAFKGTTQLYGQSKLQSEAHFAAAGGRSARLGLVYGERGGGMSRALERLTRMPIVPVLAAQSYQFTVHEDDVAEGLFALSQEAASVPEIVGLAHPQAVPFPRLLAALARRAGNTPTFVHVPWRPVYVAMRTAEMAHLTLPVRADSLLGLARPAAAVPEFGTWSRLGVAIRPFAWT